MALNIYKIKPYDHEADEQTFVRLASVLPQFTNGEEEVLLIANFAMGGTRADALLVAPSGVKIIYFCHWQSPITASANGTWTAGGQLIAGPDGRRSPISAWNQQRRRLRNAFSQWLGADFTAIKVSLLCPDHTQADLSSLPPKVTDWLELSDAQASAVRMLEQNKS